MSLLGREFQDVDASDRPSDHVAYLDAVSGQDGVRAYKHRSYQAMRIAAGSHVLDVGCGAGDDLRELAKLVGPTGRVVGVDNSHVMLAEARSRTRALPVECRLGNAESLHFDDESFDACRADRVLQHLDDPSSAVSEMVRVNRPGAWIVLIDPDWGSLVVTGHDRAVTRKIIDLRCDGVANGWIGRDLLRLAGDAGLGSLTVEPTTAGFTDLATADQLLHLNEAARHAAAAGIITADEADAWWVELNRSHAGGRFLAALTAFMVSGRKPG